MKKTQTKKCCFTCEMGSIKTKRQNYEDQILVLCREPKNAEYDLSGARGHYHQPDDMCKFFKLNPVLRGKKIKLVKPQHDPTTPEA